MAFRLPATLDGTAEFLFTGAKVREREMKFGNANAGAPTG
jgi:hypothetical protein